MTPDDATCTLEPAHDSDAWETVAGWFWACRTCLDRGWAVSGAEAHQKRARHDAGPIPWWVKRINQSDAADTGRQTALSDACLPSIDRSADQ